LGGQILDFADDGFTGEDFAEDDMFAVKVGGGDGGNEKLGAVGACAMVSSAFEGAESK